jgi:hypothetical protein
MMGAGSEAYRALLNFAFNVIAFDQVRWSAKLDVHYDLTAGLVRRKAC